MPHIRAGSNFADHQGVSHIETPYLSVDAYLDQAINKVVSPRQETVARGTELLAARFPEAEAIALQNDILGFRSSVKRCDID